MILPTRNSYKKAEIDMRFSFGCCIMSGHGKAPIRQAIEESANLLKKEVVSIMSLHPEQLVGKKWTKQGEKKSTEIRGYLDKDFLIKDDALTFINNAKFKEARDYILQSLETYGKNEIVKKVVEEKDGLKYFPKNSFLYFIQPSETIKEANLAGGLFRRAPILKIEFTDEEENEIIRERLDSYSDSEPTEWIKCLSFINSINFFYNKDIDRELKNLIIEESIKAKSKNILLSAMTYVNQNTMIKWSYINALIRYYINYSNKANEAEIKITITDEDVKKAISDYKIVFGAIKKFVSDNDELVNVIDKEILEYLYKKEAINLASSISGKELREYIVSEMETSISNYNTRLGILKKDLRLNTKQGKYDSQVWFIAN